jgi:Ca-activated chloride channel homolog
MDILYRYQPLAETDATAGDVDWKDIFGQIYLRANGDMAQTLEWLRRLGERNGLFTRDLTFEDVLDQLEKAGLIRRDKSGFEVTPRGEQTVRDQVYDRVFRNLSRSLKGEHRTGRSGRGGERLSETRDFRHGDDIGDVDFRNSLRNSLRRLVTEKSELEPPTALGVAQEWREDDFEVHEREEHSACSTVLMIDISHSMILYGEDRITPAKNVAISLSEHIRRHYPRDTLDVLTFGDEAQEIPVRDIAKVAVGPFHTNTCDGLRLARSILRRRHNANKRILMVTDGKPSAIFDRGRLYRNSFGLDPLVLEKTYGEAHLCRKEKIRVTTFMVASDPLLIEFVETFTRLCQGQAFFTGLGRLGEFVFVDYAQNRRGKTR